MGNPLAKTATSILSGAAVRAERVVDRSHLDMSNKSEFLFSPLSSSLGILTNTTDYSKMAFMKQGKAGSLYMLCLLVLTGCTSVLITGASGGIAYTVTNVAYKTIVSPIDQVEFANRLALMKMKIKYVERMEMEDGVKIIAETSALNIYISLEEITPKTTKIAVNAEKNFVVKDKATAVAIIEETEAMLEKD